ncbi:hypothetical protein GCM10007874_37370 [Labrys miyagiensis]|uniref:Uncharacterized protein n=1 Tax=Labrys miyagiensis TaxID=346912 RepID=A0ABQ6CKM2_9HYPH|nr:hypothetical protein GCM10007874_37370 [Labrys miyagiensis]
MATTQVCGGMLGGSGKGAGLWTPVFFGIGDVQDTKSLPPDWERADRGAKTSGKQARTSIFARFYDVENMGGCRYR